MQRPATVVLLPECVRAVGAPMVSCPAGMAQGEGRAACFYFFLRGGICAFVLGVYVTQEALEEGAASAA
jgi:hypothetical protein